MRQGNAREVLLRRKIHPSKIHRERDVFSERQRRQELEELEHDVDRPAPPDRRFPLAQPVDGSAGYVHIPEVGRSIPVIMLMSDLPLPDFPMTATNSPGSTCRSIPLSAVNARANAGVDLHHPVQVGQGTRDAFPAGDRSPRSGPHDRNSPRLSVGTPAALSVTMDATMAYQQHWQYQT